MRGYVNQGRKRCHCPTRRDIFWREWQRNKSWAARESNRSKKDLQSYLAQKAPYGFERTINKALAQIQNQPRKERIIIEWVTPSADHTAIS